jgi:hypothetical protein
MLSYEINKKIKKKWLKKSNKKNENQVWYNK